MKFFKEIYGVGILFFYFLKWPFVLGFGYLYFFGNLKDNYILNILWIYCFVLIIKDLIYFLKYGNRCKTHKPKR